MDLLLMLVLASILGSVGAAIAGKREQGCLVSIAVGFIGALVGRTMQRTFEVSDPLTITLGDQSFPVFWTIAGSALFVAVITLLTGRRTAKR